MPIFSMSRSRVVVFVAVVDVVDVTVAVEVVAVLLVVVVVVDVADVTVAVEVVAVLLAVVVVDVVVVVVLLVVDVTVVEDAVVVEIVDVALSSCVGCDKDLASSLTAKHRSFLTGVFHCSFPTVRRYCRCSSASSG